MTNLLAAYEASDETFTIAARELTNARNALVRSKSKANIARFNAANDAFDVALAAVTIARDAYEAAIEAAEVIAAAEAAKTNEVQMGFAF